MYLSVKVTPVAIGPDLFIDVEYKGDIDHVGPVRYGHEYTAVLQVEEVRSNTTNPKKLRRKSKKLEEQMVGESGGFRHKGSGSLGYLKGDARIKGKARVEHKFTQSKSREVSLEELQKIEGECGPGERPAFALTFVEKNTLREIDTWVMIPKQEWEKYIASLDHQRPSQR